MTAKWSPVRFPGVRLDASLKIANWIRAGRALVIAPVLFAAQGDTVKLSIVKVAAASVIEAGFLKFKMVAGAMAPLGVVADTTVPSTRNRDSRAPATIRLATSWPPENASPCHRSGRMSPSASLQSSYTANDSRAAADRTTNN